MRLLLANIALGIWCLGIAAGLGAPLAARLASGHRAAIRVGLAFLLGTALLSYAVLALGLAGALRPRVLAALLTLLSAPLIVGCRRIAAALCAVVDDARRDTGSAGWTVRVPVAIAIGLTLLSIVTPLLAVTNADALGYGTAVPERYARDARIAFHPDNYESAFVLLVETLHTIGYVFGLRPTGVWFETAAQILLLFAAADCARAIWDDDRSGSAYVYGAALLLVPLTQLMPFMAKAHLVELLAVVVLAALLLEAPARGGWLGAAACAGVAAALKYNAGLGIAALLGPLAIRSLWRARYALGWRDLAAMFAIAVGTAAPFYTRNWAWTGSPIFPMSVAGFTSPFHLQHHDDWIASLFYKDSGFGRTPLDLILWWPRAAIFPVRGSASYMGSFALAFLPLAFVPPRARHTAILFAGFVLATIVLFTFGAQFERYFIAPIAVMTLLAVAGWDRLRGGMPSVRIAGCLLLCGLGLGITLPLKAYGLWIQAPSIASSTGEARVLDRTTPWYGDFVRIRTLVGPSAPVLCVLRNCQYLGNYRREDALFRPAEAHRLASGGFDPRPVFADLRAQGIAHVVALAADEDALEPASVVEWLRRCAGDVVYRNREARFGVRDPRLVRTGHVIVIALGDRLTADGQQLKGRCVPPRQIW